jgi:hypothetical protein
LLPILVYLMVLTFSTSASAIPRPSPQQYVLCEDVTSPCACTKAYRYNSQLVTYTCNVVENRQRTGRGLIPKGFECSEVMEWAKVDIGGGRSFVVQYSEGCELRSIDPLS